MVTTNTSSSGKNLVFQTERLTHYLQSAMTSLDKQKQTHAQELEQRLQQKDEIIVGLENAKNTLQQQMQTELNAQESELEELKKQIEALQSIQPAAAAETEEFAFDDQLKYLSNIGKGLYE